MKKVSISLIFTFILLSGCTGGGKNTEQVNIPQTPTPEDTSSTETPNSSTSSNQNAFNDSLTSLIPPINPQERLQEITQGRGDPFGSIQAPPVVRKPAGLVESPSPFSPVAIVRESVATVSTDVVANSPMGDAGNPMVNNQVSGVSNTVVTNPDGSRVTVPSNGGGAIAPPPEPPQPTDAENITVSGIADLRGENVAFIRTPWDNSTRTVRVGDLLSNGEGVTIRVRNIQFAPPTTLAFVEDGQTIFRDISNSNGTIVLEQYGQQVTRQIFSPSQETGGS